MKCHSMEIVRGMIFKSRSLLLLFFLINCVEYNNKKLGTINNLLLLEIGIMRVEDQALVTVMRR